MFSNNLLMAAASASGGGGYSVGNSILLNDNDSAYMSWTPSGAADSARIGTMSFWLKGGNLPTTTNNIIQQDWPSTGNNGITVQWNSTTYDNKLSFTMETSAGGIIFNKWTTLSFRDPTAWAHIWFTWDLNQTDSTCFTLYINGVNITSFSTDTNNGSAQDGGFLTTTKAIGLGRHQANGNAYLDGYLSQVYVQDGVTGVYTDAGEFDDQGEWRPIDVTGLTFGTNGFLLDFAVAPGTGNGAGTDVSGNGNNFTDSGLAAADQVTDTPTNNWCTLNPLQSGTLTISNGNTSYVPGTSWNGIAGTQIMTSGKWYWECNTGTSLSNSEHGIVDNPERTNWLTLTDAPIKNGWAVDTANRITYNHSTSGDTDYTGSMLSDEVVGVAVDFDNGKMWFRDNADWMGGGDPAAGTSPAFTDIPTDGTPCVPAVALNNSTAFQTINFGQTPLGGGGNADGNGYGDFDYAPPTGFLALCTANLTALDFDPADHHQVELVNHDGTSTSFTLSWDADTYDTLFIIKNRDNIEKWFWVDGLRGYNKYMSSDETTAETTDANVISVSGTTITLGSTLLIDNYVVECHRAGDAGGASNTDGTVTGTVSANSVTGFSIALHTDPNDASSYSVGHSLSSTPPLIIAKRRTGTGGWYVNSPELTDRTGYYLKLETNAAEANSAGVWGAGPTATVCGYLSGGLWVGNTPVVTYCWDAVEGYSAFGSYVGNGSSDGPMINPGIKPNTFFVKSSSTGGSSYEWNGLYAEANGDVNGAGNGVQWSTDAAESSGNNVDLLSNGAKIRLAGIGFNGSGVTYIYMAWGTPIVDKSETPAKAR